MHPLITSTARALLLSALLIGAGSGCQSINTPVLRASASSLNGALLAGAGLYVVTAVANSRPESRGVLVSSKPLGARVLIDGKDSGFATPCCLAIDDREQRIDLVLDGYQTASRVVNGDGRTYLIYWNDGYPGPSTYRFPMYLNFYDFYVPLRFEETYSPERLFVRMRPAPVP